MGRILFVVAAIALGCSGGSVGAEGPESQGGGSGASGQSTAAIGGADGVGSGGATSTKVDGGAADNGGTTAATSATGATEYVCDPGETNACHCSAPFGVGAQKCLADRSGWGECDCSTGSGGTTSTGGMTGTGGATDGGKSSYGGTSSSSSGTSGAQSCRYIGGDGKDKGPCAAATKGAWHCNDAGECVACSDIGLTLDCDGDGVCEKTSDGDNCGLCGNRCSSGVCTYVLGWSGYGCEITDD